jgi:hypothetical protein
MLLKAKTKHTLKLKKGVWYTALQMETKRIKVKSCPCA